MDVDALVVIEGPAKSWRTFSGHFLEMVAVMYVGMGVGSLLFLPILNAMELTTSEARLRFPELYLLAMAVTMTAPMVAWMRYRGHGWRSSAEMAAAMILPGIFILGLFWLGFTAGPGCSLYCGLMIPAMFVVMLLRRDEYSQSHRRHHRAMPRPG